MTWTYVAGESAKDRVRLLVGDTVSTDQLISDEELAAFLPGGAMGEPSELHAAAAVCEAIASRMARNVDLSGGGSSASMSQQTTAYRQRAQALRRQAAMKVVPFAGGTSIAGRDAEDANSDRVPPAFTRGEWQVTV